MRDEAVQFDALVDRFMKLGRADRRAVLASMTPGERELFERELAGARHERQRDLARARLANRQFAGYSPWLAAIIGSASKGDGGESPRTRACNAAIVLAHRAASDEPAEGGALGRFLRQLGIPGVDVGRDGVQ